MATRAPATMTMARAASPRLQLRSSPQGPTTPHGPTFPSWLWKLQDSGSYSRVGNEGRAPEAVLVAVL